MTSFWLRRPLAAFFLVVWAAPAWADGECAGGYRDTTDAERTAMRAAIEVAREAMPAPPAGWIINGDDVPAIIESLCRDYDTGAWSYGHRRLYQRIDDQAERDAILQQAAATLKADLATKESRLAAIEARIGELSAEVVVAAEKGDYARLDELNVQMEAASEAYGAILAEGDADDQARSAQAEVNRDLVMTVDIDFNTSRDAPRNDGAAWSPAGVPGTAFRWHDTASDFQVDEALILLGNWAVGADGMMHAPLSATGDATRVQSMSLRVTADPGRIEDVVRAIDFAALQSLIAGR